MTIRKNTRRADAVFTTATGCRVYSLGNYFRGEEVDPAFARDALHKFDFAKLTYTSDGRYVVHVHSNLWYELRGVTEPTQRTAAETMSYALGHREERR